MKKLSYYPAAGTNGYGNPYSVNYKSAMSAYYEVLEADNKAPRYNMLGLYILKRAFQADVYIYNWIENIGTFRLPMLQLLLTALAILVVKCRRKKIVWMFHNIHPHSGATFYSHTVSWLLFHTASLIVSHSKEAADYARKKTKKKVLFLCHPVKPFSDEELRYAGKVEDCDVLIWGSIIKYKGIEEFISLPEVQKSKLKIRIIGTGKDKELIKGIRQWCNNHICLDEKRASFGEIAAYCKTAKYVLFPYVGDCVSSSGALIDTIAMGGVPVGPNVGAFKDLSEEKVCITYNNYSDLLKILQSERVCDNNIANFFKKNSWRSFAEVINNEISRK